MVKEEKEKEQMAKFIGTAEAFVLVEDFDLYVRRLEHFFKFNSVKDTENTGFLCSFGGAELHKIIVVLTAPKTENDFAYSELGNKS